MYGYKISKPKTIPEAVWACKAFVDSYDWKNSNTADMVEFSICKAKYRTVQIENYEPIGAFGTSFSCVVGNSEIKSYAEEGVEVDIVSVAVSFSDLKYELKLLGEDDTKDKDVLLLPCLLTDLPMQDTMEIENILYRFTSEYVKKEASSDMLCMAAVFELLSILDGLVRKSLKVKHKKYVNYYVLKVDSILSRRYSEKLTLGSVAAEVGITPNYLSAIYKSCTGVGFSDRLCELRMTGAAKLVLEDKLSLSKIAEAVGIEDESHLRRRFKQYFGISIREYRWVNKEQTLYHQKPQRKNSSQ